MHRKLYEDFKPRFVFWKLVLMARKLALASIAVMMDKLPLLQASTSIAVIFVFYILHQRYVLCLCL